MDNGHFLALISVLFFCASVLAFWIFDKEV